MPEFYLPLDPMAAPWNLFISLGLVRFITNGQKRFDTLHVSCSAIHFTLAFVAGVGSLPEPCHFPASLLCTWTRLERLFEFLDGVKQRWESTPISSCSTTLRCQLCEERLVTLRAFRRPFRWDCVSWWTFVRSWYTTKFQNFGDIVQHKGESNGTF